MNRMNRETVLCTDTDRLCGWGFSIGHGDRGAHVLVDKSGQRDRHAVVVVAQDRTVIGCTFELHFIGNRRLVTGGGEIAVAVVGRIEGQQHSAAGGERSVLEEIEQVVVSIAGCLCILRVSVRHGSCRGRTAEIRGLDGRFRDTGRVNADFTDILRCELARER